MRVMALDVGERTVGIAISDELGMIASPRETLRRDGSEIERLRVLTASEEVGKVIVGLPISMDGSQGPSAQRVLLFVDALRGALEVPVITWDERLTTAEAEKMLIAAETRRSRRRQVVDQVAAAL